MPAPQLTAEGVYASRKINQTANNKPRVDWRGDLYLRVVKIFLHDINLARFGDEQTVVRERKFIKAKELGEITFARFPDLPRHYQSLRSDGEPITGARLFDRLFNMYYSRDPKLPSPFVLSTEHIDNDPKLAEIAHQVRAMLRDKPDGAITFWDVLQTVEESGPGPLKSKTAV